MSILNKLFQMARRATPEQPDNRQDNIVFIKPPIADVHVDEITAYNYAAAWAAVKVITETISCLPFRVYERDGSNRKQSDHPIDELLHISPNPEMPAFAFRETLQAHALTWGNGYAEIERSRGNGNPIALWPITPDRVTPRRDSAGRLYYEVRQTNGSQQPFKASDIFHLKGLGFDGLQGYSPIEMARESIALGKASENFASAFFGNGAHLGGVIMNETNKLDEGGVRNLLKTFNKLHRGSRKSHKVGYLDGGMKYQEIGVKPENAQLLELRKFQINEVARWFRLPPHKIADLDRATFSNIEEQNIDFAKDSIMPWAIRWEQEADIKLFTNRKRYFTKMNLNGLMRGDSKSRGEYYKIMTSIGAFSINNVLELEDMNTIGEAGNLRLVPMNMVSITEAQRNGETGQTRTRSTDQKDNMRAYLCVFRDVFSRLRRKECKAIDRAADKPGYTQWLMQFYEGMERDVCERLKPPTESFVKIFDINVNPDKLVQSYATIYCDRAFNYFIGYESTEAYKQECDKIALEYLEAITQP